MLDFEQMLIRLLVAIALGFVIGLERELIGKEAGIKTCMLVSSGAAIFTIIGIQLPFLIEQGNIQDIVARNSGFLSIIGNIVIGVGFLGAGMILKTERHVHGLTTAAVIWVSAAIGILAGLGIYRFALTATLLLSGLLFILRSLSIEERIVGKE